MKIAVLADIHGNLPALEAVVADLKGESPDLVVNLGDCVSGPLWPRETGECLMGLDWPTVRGNHDRIATGPRVPYENRTDHITQSDISAEVIQWLSALPQTLDLTDEITCFHATPHCDDLYLSETVTGGRGFLSSEEEITARLGADAPAPILLFGHTHIPRLIRLRSGQTLFNPGSVGCPAYTDETPEPHLMEAGSPHARYGLMLRRGAHWHFTLKAIDYDHERAARRAADFQRPVWVHALRSGFCPAA
ncbi:metallophosphoesterase family protein [Roseibium aestuarii]|uniref:Metallophosphoesterase family protein n=1 Tax=Roseibium aestuarii TaxID=2600299 RepID=A0ABW4K118_9HYPH|nr:metallophosphoesterase family protein [Roseibium aestuarii]